MEERYDPTDVVSPADTGLLRIVFQGKWRLKVLLQISKGPVRLSQLKRAMPECSKKVLIDTLHGLEEMGWIERREYPTTLKKVEYAFTSRCERDIRRAIAIASGEV
jgi:DNA-binding HxlR family transcriptional regulator